MPLLFSHAMTEPTSCTYYTLKVKLAFANCLELFSEKRIHTSERHSLFYTIFRLGRHTEPHMSFYSLHVQV